MHALREACKGEAVAGAAQLRHCDVTKTILPFFRSKYYFGGEEEFSHACNIRIETMGNDVTFVFLSQRVSFLWKKVHWYGTGNVHEIQQHFD